MTVKRAIENEVVFIFNTLFAKVPFLQALSKQASFLRECTSLCLQTCGMVLLAADVNHATDIYGRSKYM